MLVIIFRYVELYIKYALLTSMPDMKQQAVKIASALEYQRW